MIDPLLHHNFYWNFTEGGPLASETILWGIATSDQPVIKNILSPYSYNQEFHYLKLKF